MLISVSLVSSLCSCGGSSNAGYRTYKKQSSPADIKISALNLATNEIKLRFEYRSYLHETLENLSCSIEFNSESLLKIEHELNIKLDAFSTEILSFLDIEITDSNKLHKLKSLNYSLKCDLKYDNGRETVFENSVVYLVPGSEFKYR